MTDRRRDGRAGLGTQPFTEHAGLGGTAGYPVHEAVAATAYLAADG